MTSKVKHEFTFPTFNEIFGTDFPIANKNKKHDKLTKEEERHMPYRYLFKGS